MGIPSFNICVSVFMYVHVIMYVYNSSFPFQKANDRIPIQVLTCLTRITVLHRIPWNDGHRLSEKHTPDLCRRLLISCASSSKQGRHVFHDRLEKLNFSSPEYFVYILSHKKITFRKSREHWANMADEGILPG